MRIDECLSECFFCSPSNNSIRHSLKEKEKDKIGREFDERCQQVKVARDENWVMIVNYYSNAPPPE